MKRETNPRGQDSATTEPKTSADQDPGGNEASEKGAHLVEESSCSTSPINDQHLSQNPEAPSEPKEEEPKPKSLDTSTASASTSDAPTGKESEQKKVKKLVLVESSSQVDKQQSQKSKTGPGESQRRRAKHRPPPTKFVFVLTFFATLGGFLMGYNIGIVSGSMLFVRPHFRLSTRWTEAIVSGAVAAAAVSALLAGWVTDMVGRRLSLLIGGVIFSIGGVVMGTAHTKELLLIGRVICGIAIGVASVVVPIYVAEVSPTRARGRLTTTWQIMINLGILVSSLIAGVFSNRLHGWRYMMGLSAIPGVLQFLGFLFLPESPRWLVDKGHIEQARNVLVRIRGYTEVSEELEEIELSVNEAKEMGLKGFRLLLKIFQTGYVRRALVVGTGLLVFQQLCGINTAVYYSGTILRMAGFPAVAATWLVVLPNSLLFLAGLIGMHIVDKVGRRPLLIWSMVGTVAGLVIIAVGFQLTETYSPHLDSSVVETFPNGTVLTRCHSEYRSCSECTKDLNCGFCYKAGDISGSCLPAESGEQSMYGRCNNTLSKYTNFRFAHGFCPTDNYSWLTTLGIALFVLFFSPGMAPVPWTLNSEIYPLWARGTCNALAATSGWASNLIISFTFLTLTEAITTYGTFWLFAGFSVLGLLFFVVMVPETRDKQLENVDELFMTSSQVQFRRASRRSARSIRSMEGGA